MKNVEKTFYRESNPKRQNRHRKGDKNVEFWSAIRLVVQAIALKNFFPFILNLELLIVSLQSASSELGGGRNCNVQFVVNVTEFMVLLCKLN